jgi:hypothetical protein
MSKPCNPNIPAEIAQLQLCRALKNCGSPVENNFQQSSATDLFIYDNDTDKYTQWRETPPASPKDFHAHNPNNKNIVLLPLDNKILTGKSIRENGVADCALLTMEELTFIEFKTNVESGTEFNVNDKLKDAKGQLLNTYSNIKHQCSNINIDIEEKHNIEFYIVFNKNLQVTNANNIFMKFQVEFANEHKKALYIDNYKQYT